MPLSSKLLYRLLPAVLVLGTPAVVRADEGAVTVSPAIVSRSVFRGQDRGRAALQTAIDTTSGDWAAGLWTSFPLEGSGASAPGTEADLYVVRTIPLARGLALVPGATIYTYPRADRAAGFPRTTFEPGLALDASVAGVRLTPKVSYDLTLEAMTLETTAAYAVALPSLGTELDFTGAAGTYLRRDDATGAAGPTKAWGNYWLVGVSLPYQLTYWTKLVAGWTYAAGSGAFIKVGAAPRVNDPRAAARGMFSLGFSTTF